MDVGIGLPSTIPGVDGRTVVAWARLAEEHGFSTLGTIDRLVYPNYEPLTVLAAAAAVTTRVRLATTILIAPLRGSGVLLAKQAATVDRLSGGRLELGVAVGGREDDFEAAGVDFHRRGRLLDEQLAELERTWRGEDGARVGPPPARAGGPRLLIGGRSEAAVRRTVRFGDGWVSGGGGPSAFAQLADTVRRTWTAAGRDGAPWLAAIGYFALGPGADEAAASFLGHYYAFAGPYAERVVGGAARTAEAVREQAAAFEQAGCDELVLFPCSPDPHQVELLAAAVR